MGTPQFSQFHFLHFQFFQSKGSPRMKGGATTTVAQIYFFGLNNWPISNTTF